MKTKSLLALAALLGAVLTATARDAYPARPVTIIVPFSAGAQIDLLARPLAEHLAKTLGRPFVILNRDGASGMIGVEAVAKSKPDGYTLGYGPQGQFTIQSNLRQNMRYKVDQFDFLCQTNSGVFVVATGPNSRFKSLAELVEAARKEPGKISFGSGGHATAPHLIAESIALEAGVKFNHIPFRNVSDMYAQVLAGTVDFAVSTPVFLNTRKDINGLAVVGEQRLASNPDIPLLKELNYKRSTMPGYIGLYAPKGMPAAAIAALRKACPGAVDSAQFRRASETIATPVQYADAPEYSASIQRDLLYMAELLNVLGIKPE